jgi:hypothetical protein
MKIIMYQKYAATVSNSNDGSHNMHVIDYGNMFLEDIEHAGRGRIKIVRDDNKILADDPAGIYEMEDGSVAYITKTLQVINPEAAATSTHAVVVALCAVKPYDLVFFTRCSAKDLTDDQKLTLYNACVQHDQGFAQEIRRYYDDASAQTSDSDMPIITDFLLSCDRLDVFDIPTWGKDDSFPLLTMIVPYDYRW